MRDVFFHDWSHTVRAMIMALLAYSALVTLLRLSGKRTLTKLNVFDFVFVVALGSSLATTILSPDVSLVDGVVAVMALIALQILLSWLCIRSHALNKIINGEPVLLMHRGKFLRDAMHRERVTEEEIRAAFRSKGLGQLQEADCVVLETDGSFSVVYQKLEHPTSALHDVLGHPSADVTSDDVSR